MGENKDEELNNEINEISDDKSNNEEIEDINEEIKDENQVGLNTSIKESETVETKEEDSEEIETDLNTEQLEQVPEKLLTEELGEEHDFDNDSNVAEANSDNKVLDEKTIEMETRVFHRNFIEAALYAAGGPLTIEELSNKLEFPKKEVEKLVNELAFDYLDRPTALVINQVGEAYQMGLRSEYVEKVSKFAKGGAIAERYLRTLTVIALKQPILKSMVIKLRGTGAYEHVKYLLDNQFIDAIKKGRSHELTTTEKYADMFGLPRDIRQMKSVMITQLGLDEGGQIEPSGEISEGDLSESPGEIEDVSQNDPVSNNEESEKNNNQ